MVVFVCFFLALIEALRDGFFFLTSLEVSILILLTPPYQIKLFGRHLGQVDNATFLERAPISDLDLDLLLLSRLVTLASIPNGRIEWVAVIFLDRKSHR